ncbi:MAG TPA: hypothetical protein VGR02_18050 [Thermoanaerobaculia bacterium]|nr:hypothetical protein [Thermoanaerobaculia bacterium]
MFTIVLATLLFSWHSDYEQAVRLIEQGKAAQAVPKLEAALAALSRAAGREVNVGPALQPAQHRYWAG